MSVKVRDIVCRGEEKRLRVIGNKILRIILRNVGSKRGEPMGEWRKLYKKKQ
jgi:hypothetical protein